MKLVGTAAPYILVALGGGLVGFLVASARQETPTVAPISASSNSPPPRAHRSTEERLGPDHAHVEASRDNRFEDIEKLDELPGLPSDFSRTEALYALAGRAGLPALDEYVRQAQSLPNRYDRRVALRILFERYAELNPQAGLGHLQQLDLDIHSQILDHFFYTWAKTAGEEAIEAAAALEPPRDRKDAGTAILRAFAEQHPGLLDEAAARLGRRQDLSRLHAQVLADRANKAPVDALNEALRIRNAPTRQHAAWRIADVWARTDPESAIAYAENISDLRIRSRFRHSVFRRWIHADPEAAMDYALTLPPSSENNQIAIDALSTVAYYDPSLAVSNADRLRPGARKQAYTQIFVTWAEQDLQAALAGAEGIADLELRSSLMQSLAYQYGAQEPAQALQWVEQFPTKAQRDQMRVNVLEAMAQQDPLIALDAALTVEGGSKRTEALASVISYMLSSHPQVASKALEHVPPGRQRRHLVTVLAQRWGERDPEAAFIWMSSLEGESYQLAFSSARKGLVSEHPELAASYVDQIRGEARHAWIDQLAGAFARRDPRAALSWLQQYKTETAYPRAVGTIADAAVWNDPEWAAQLARSIGNSQVRNDAVKSVMSAWTQKTPVPAAQWAESIADDELRLQAISAVASRWVANDPASAGRWAAALPMGSERDAALAAIDARRARD